MIRKLMRFRSVVRRKATANVENKDLHGAIATAVSTLRLERTPNGYEVRFNAKNKEVEKAVTEAIDPSDVADLLLDDTDLKRTDEL